MGNTPFLASQLAILILGSWNENLEIQLVQVPTGDPYSRVSLGDSRHLPGFMSPHRGSVLVRDGSKTFKKKNTDSLASSQTPITVFGIDDRALENVSFSPAASDLNEEGVTFQWGWFCAQGCWVLVLWPEMLCKEPAPGSGTEGLEQHLLVDRKCLGQKTWQQRQPRTKPFPTDRTKRELPASCNGSRDSSHNLV